MFMKPNRNSRGRIFLSYKLLALGVMLCAVPFFLLILYPDRADSGPYLNSAHGNSSYGVNRTSLSAFGYSKGNCAHCHEQHASIGGAEPNPTGGPDKFALFYTNHVRQTDNLCFKCHTDINAYQSVGIVNRSYSYRAGGYADALNDVLEAFSFTAPATSHYLDNIKSFIAGKSWNYTSDSNPCASCHNPHAVKGDPANSPNSAKSSGTRGYSPVSRPSQHSNDNTSWGLWGDVAAERMNTYANSLGGIYQSPFFSGGITYEPEGSATQDGSNLTDFDTFCIDCHNNTDNISSTPLGRPLYKFNWANEMHGGGAAVNNGAIAEMNAPYQDAQLGSYVLACTDCHEPHGSPNNYLIRKQVNNGTVTVTQYGAGSGPPAGSCNFEWNSICYKCHKIDNNPPHVHPTDLDGNGGTSECTVCHDFSGCIYRVCSYCHYHGNNVIPGYGVWSKPLF